MEKNKYENSHNTCKNTHTAKVLYIQDYFKKRESLKNTEEDQVKNSLGKPRGQVVYLDEDRQKTLDLFVKVLHSMRKESFR